MNAESKCYICFPRYKRSSFVELADLYDVSIGITTEIFIIIFSSGLLSWVIKWIEFESGKDLFKDVLLTAHIHYALPLCIVIVLVLTVVAAALPAVTVFRYQPCELIGGTKNGNH